MNRRRMEDLEREYGLSREIPLESTKPQKKELASIPDVPEQKPSAEGGSPAEVGSDKEGSWEELLGEKRNWFQADLDKAWTELATQREALTQQEATAFLERVNSGAKPGVSRLD
jgi:hypothetical protein